MALKTILSTPTLIPEFTVHCFFAGTCKHVEVAFDPRAASDQMEAHYADEHQADIDRAIAWMH